MPRGEGAKAGVVIGPSAGQSGLVQADQANGLLLLFASHAQDQGGETNAQSKADNTEKCAPEGLVLGVEKVFGCCHGESVVGRLTALRSQCAGNQSERGSFVPLDWPARTGGAARSSPCLRRNDAHGAQACRGRLCCCDANLT